MSKHSLRLGGGKWAAKEDKLLAYAEGNISGKFLPHELDFSRGSDIGATRINKEGLIEKARENMFTYSSDFRQSTPWGHAGLALHYGPENNPASIPDGEKGYDGSGRANWILSSNTGDPVPVVHRVALGSQSSQAVQTFSIYAKALGYKWIRVGTNSDTMEAFFDLENGEVGTVGSNVVQTYMIDAGNGWYRCAIAVNSNVTVTGIHFGISDGDNNELFHGNRDKGGTNRGGIYVMDAQWELGLVPTSYMHSATTTTGKAGHSEDMPRIDYRNGNPQLLIEPKRKNLVPRSESLEFSGSLQRVAMDFGYMSPEGVKNAYKVTAIPDAGDPLSHFFISNQFTITASRKYVVSAFVKPLGDLSHIRFGFTDQDGSHAIYSYFDLTGDGGKLNETASGTGVELDDFGIEKVGSDGWFRVFVAGDLGATTEAKLACFLAPNATTTTFTGDNETSALWYGLQCEVALNDADAENNAAQAPTSYIPTHGTSVTREFDHITHLSSASTDGILGNYNTTLFFDGVSYVNYGLNRFITLYDASSSSDPRIVLYAGEQSGNKFEVIAQFRKNNSSADDVMILTPDEHRVKHGDDFKCLLRLNGTKMALYLNGAKMADDSTIEKQDDIQIVDFTNIVGDLNHHVNDIQLFPFSLTDNDCEILTAKTNYRSFADMSETLNYDS